MRFFLAFGAFNGFAAIAAGALEAHALRNVIVDGGSWATATLYQIWHGLALVALAALFDRGFSHKILSIAGWCLSAGVVLFVWLLYYRALVGEHLIYMAVPVGGLVLMAGWLSLILAAVSKPKPSLD